MLLNINLNGLNAEAEFDHEEADHSVGWNGNCQLIAVYVNDCDISEYLSPKAIENIEQELFERVS